MWYSSGFRAALVIITVVTGPWLVSCHDAATNEPEVFAVAGSTMGTSWSLQWIDHLPLEKRHSPDVIKLSLQTELDRINALMSTWDPNSQLSAFNALASIEPVALHDDTLQVIDTALSISKLTGGRYDISLQPVIDLWGFNRNDDQAVPTESDIAGALEISGYRQLVRIGNTLRKRRPEIALDVSSLAKGYAVDKLGEVVESLGVIDYLVDIGGEVRARGERSDDLPWRVGIETPEGQVEQVIALRDSHIASSGSYRNYRIENGKRLSHIIDGVSGRPVEHNVVSVSVVHESTMLADAWATALLVVGEKRALEIIDSQALDAQLTVVRDGEFQQISTAGFDALLLRD